MKLLTTLEIIIIIVVLIATALFLISWVGFGYNPLEWFKRESVKNSFCSEVVSRSNCLTISVSKASDLGLSKDDVSSRIQKKELGLQKEGLATYGEVCNYFGYKNFDECLKKLCGCKIGG